MEVDEVVELIEELLTEKEKMLVVLYYTEGLTLKEIGEILEVSESRVSQLHTAMAMRIRKKLEKMGEPFKTALFLIVGEISRMVNKEIEK